MKSDLAEKFLKTAFEEIIFPPEISERFTVIELIGRNDFGETFIASENDSKDLYVLKAQRSFETASGNEAELLLGLNHSGLPRFNKVIEQDGARYFLRKYIEGEPLDEYLSETPSADTARAVDVLISLCDILIYLHSQPEPIIHRDIKPSNIIIDPQSNSVMLIDFGISRKYQEDAEKDTVYLGTHKFAPPEQYGFAQTDCRTDIFSLGMVMRYWLTGTADRSVKIPDKELERIAAKCTALAPETRFQDVAALKKALNKYKTRTKRAIIKTAAGLAAACVVLFAGLAVKAHFDNQPEAVFTPYGYNHNDYQKMVNFFSYGNNEAAIKAVNPDFNLADPQTWNGEGIEIVWAYNSDRRVKEFWIQDIAVNGSVDFSGLDELVYLVISGTGITELDLSGCHALLDIHLDGNQIESIDVSGLAALRELTVDRNLLTSLDLSENPELTLLCAGGNKLTELDLSANTLLIGVHVWDNDLTSAEFLTGLPNLNGVNIEWNNIDLYNPVQKAAVDEVWAAIKARNINGKFAFENQRNTEEVRLPLETALPGGICGGYGIDPDCQHGAGCIAHDNTDYMRSWLTYNDSHPTVAEFLSAKAIEFRFTEEPAGMIELFWTGDSYTDYSNNRVYIPVEEILFWENTIRINFEKYMKNYTDFLNCNESLLVAIGYWSPDGRNLIEMGLHDVRFIGVSGSRQHFTPAGYNANDYQKLISFFKHGNNEAAVKAANPAFNLADPQTWKWDTEVTGTHENGDTFAIWSGIEWREFNGEHRVKEILFWNDAYAYSTTGELSGALDVSDFTYLDTLHFADNKITGVNVSGCDALKYVNLSGNLLTELDLSGLSSLREVRAWHNQLTELNLSGCTSLEWLEVAYNRLTKLDFTDNSLLRRFHGFNNQLTELDLSHLTALRDVRLFNNRLTEVKLPPSGAIRHLDLGGNLLKSIDISGQPALEHLHIWDNQLTTLSVSENTALEFIDMTGNMISALDLSGLNALNILRFYNNRLNEKSFILPQSDNLMSISAVGNDFESLAMFERLKKLCYFSIRHNYLNVKSPEILASIGIIEQIIENNTKNPPDGYNPPEWFTEPHYGFYYEPQNS